MHAEAEELAVLVERQLGLGHMVAALAVGDETFLTLGHPFDGNADLLGRPGDDRLLAIEELLDAEAAADVGRDHPHLLLRDLEHQRAHQPAHDMRELAGRIERVVAGAGIVFGDRGARLHRVADQPVVDEAEPGDMRGLGESGLRRRLVAERPIAAQIAGDIVEQLRRAGRTASSTPTTAGNGS